MYTLIRFSVHYKPIKPITELAVLKNLFLTPLDEGSLKLPKAKDTQDIDRPYVVRMFL